MTLDLDFSKKFKGFSLNVKFRAANDIVALFGGSGCGKSLTLKCIAGIHKPDRGHIIVNDRVLFEADHGINLPPQERKVGLLFQNYALFPNMTVEQNIACGLREKFSSTERKKKVSALIENFYLNGLENHHPEQISGGQQQRTALARILAGDPEILMLDEPLSALDAYLRWQLEQELITTLSQFNQTAIYVSHSRGEVYRICEKVVMMENGQSDRIQNVKDLFEKPHNYAAALLSGCKNFSRVVVEEKTRVWAEDWQTSLLCGREIPPNIRYIGVQSSAVQCNGQENAIECSVKRITEDISKSVVSIIPVRVKNKTDQSTILMELDKKEAQGLSVGQRITIGVNEEDILLLE